MRKRSPHTVGQAGKGPSVSGMGTWPRRRGLRVACRGPRGGRALGGRRVTARRHARQHAARRPPASQGHRVVEAAPGGGGTGRGTRGQRRARGPEAGCGERRTDNGKRVSRDQGRDGEGQESRLEKGQARGCPGLHGAPPRKSHVRVPTPGACGLDLIRKRVFAHGQVEVGSLGRALVPCDCAVMSRGQHTDTHRGTAMRDAGRGRRPHARGSGRGGVARPHPGLGSVNV